MRKRLPGLSREEIELVEQGLREWFVCCAWRWNTVLGMPSRAVDEAWHEFILDTRTYTSFCVGAFGEYAACFVSGGSDGGGGGGS